MKRLEGDTIIVTGAAGAIGAAVTDRCLAEGAIVLACDQDNVALSRLAGRQVSAALHTFVVDVGDYQAVTAFFDVISQRFPIACGLVNNAGIYPGRNILDYSAEEINRVIATNICGATYFAQQFGRLLLAAKGRGSLVNISSVAGQEGSSDAVYGLSKAALLGLTKSLAMNFAPHIRVNAVAPGLVTSPLLDNVPPWRMEEYRKSELLSQAIQPEDVAASVAFLLADESRNYSGAILDLNNGCYRR